MDSLHICQLGSRPCFLAAFRFPFSFPCFSILRYQEKQRLRIFQIADADAAMPTFTRKYNKETHTILLVYFKHTKRAHPHQAKLADFALKFLCPSVVPTLTWVMDSSDITELSGIWNLVAVFFFFS